MFEFNFCFASPIWLDYVQAIAAFVAVVGTIASLYTLAARDKEREAQIASLASVASSLDKIQMDHENRLKMMKKPILTARSDFHNEKDSLHINFINHNVNCGIVDFEYKFHLYNEVQILNSDIHEDGGKQNFRIAIGDVRKLSERFTIRMLYRTEDDETYMQDILVVREKSGEYAISSGPVNKLPVAIQSED